MPKSLNILNDFYFTSSEIFVPPVGEMFKEYEWRVSRMNIFLK